MGQDENEEIERAALASLNAAAGPAITATLGLRLLRVGRATAPPFRGRGVQRAVLARRLRLADGLGLARVHTCAGEAVAGDPQHSCRNILRCVFTEGRLRGKRAPPRS